MNPDTKVQMPPAPVLGMSPVAIKCPKCADEVVTSVYKEFQGWGWVVALCCCAGVVCAVVPCCMDDLNEYKHRCPKECGYAIGSYTPQGSGRKILTGILILGICLTVGVIILRFVANV